MRYFFSLIIFLFAAGKCFATEFHVSKSGRDTNEGSFQKPFLTIQRAATVAVAGDTITVHAGTYREQITPRRGGESDSKRILYRAAPDEKVEVKGSELLMGWTRTKDGLWRVTIPASFFRGYNSCQDSVFGDWFDRNGRVHHTADLFLDGNSLYEQPSLEHVLSPRPEPNTRDTLGARYRWFCESNATRTTIYANFQNRNPNQSTVELSVRRTCVYPEQPGINYITIRGFDFSQAATQWAAPTAEQVGMIATHWNKGWIIENNIIHDTKSNGITLGKERGTGHNTWSSDAGNVNRDGNIHYIEVVFRTLRNGWNKETIGSHIVRNNIIFNCEQTGICGSMGAAFSRIENNHIYNIWTKRQFDGAEIAGIKFHGAVDAIIQNNRIHQARRAIWLDWMTQGTRVSKNLFYDNDSEDIYIEVNHGPFVVDNNIFLSPVSIKTQSQGGAFVHNLFCGDVFAWGEPNRFTPYFLPHSTDIAGLTTIFGGDDRYCNNIFLGKGDTPPTPDHKYGLEDYNAARLPSWMNGNIFYHGARPSTRDSNFIRVASFNPGAMISEESGSIFLTLACEPLFLAHRVPVIGGAALGKAKIPKAAFENADGSPLMIDTDYFGTARVKNKNHAGPFLGLTETPQRLMVWQSGSLSH
jgi:hypothetical protein